jgi:hypothetical protein
MSKTKLYTFMGVVIAFAGVLYFAMFHNSEGGAGKMSRAESLAKARAAKAAKNMEPEEEKAWETALNSEPEEDNV